MHEPQLVGTSAPIAELRRRMERLLQSAARLRPPPVVLQGETGAGKGLVAKVLHRMSARAAMPFVDVNCAAIPEPLLESELFGYERGAFTDARRSKPGLFQVAHGGTLFLDEVGLLPLSLQAKLLTVLEERAVRRLGATRKEPVDVWILSASNADLAAEVRAQHFREDLYHRLALVTLWVPPLRDRHEDIVLLAEHFLERTRADYGLPPLTLADDARKRLMTYPWPGNVRELANVIERAVVLGDSPRIGASALGLVAPVQQTAGGGAALLPEPRALGSHDNVMREHLRDTLQANGGNISLTARNLGITRNTVRARMQKFGLRVDDGRAEEERPRTVSSDRAVPQPAEPAVVPPAPERSAGVLPRSIRWERRRVTITRMVLTARPGAEWASADRGLQFVIDKVQAFGGGVRDMSPLSVGAIFGVDASEEAPRRAAHAALAIVKGFEREQNFEVSAPRIVIHSGPALVGYIGETGHLDQQSAGPLSNALNSLLAVAAPGDVVVSTSTAAFLERRFALEPRQLADPPATRAYRLSGYERSGLGLWGTPSRFVGRASELDRLRRQSMVVLAGHGQVIGIVGDPGVGKSRLIFEFRRRHASPAWRSLEATCVAWGRTLYHLSAELLRAYFGLEPGASAESARARIDAVLASSGESAGAMASALLTVLGLAAGDPSWERLDPTEQRRRMIESVRQLLVVESRRQPLLLIVDDAHWIDAESRGVLEALVPGVGDEQILLLISHRPQYQHAWAAASMYTELRIGPLATESAHELLDGLLGHDESFTPLKGTLVNSTEGNPLFLEESVRALADSGALDGERGDYRLVRPVTHLEVPPTVEEVLAARIDRLSPADRQLLQMAAIIGPRVRLPILRAVASLDDTALDTALGRLHAAELLDTQAVVGGTELTFRHSLTYDVALLSLPPVRRQAIHGQVLEAIEEIHPETGGDRVDRLAYHAREGAVWSKALVYTREAGDRALRAAATLKAVEYYEQALEVLGHAVPNTEARAEGIELRLRLRDALWPLGRLPEILGHLRTAEVMATEAGDTRRLGWISCYLCQLHWSMGDNERALEAGRRALPLALSLAEEALEAETRFYLGITHHALGHARQAAESLLASVAILDRATAGATDRFPSRPFALSGRAIVRAWLAWALAELGQFREGIAWGREAIDLAEAMANPFALVAATAGLGILHTRRWSLEEARSYLERALDLCRTYSLHNWFPAMATCLGHVYVGFGRVDEGVALLEQGLQAASRAGIVARSDFGMMQLAEGYLRAGRRAEADTALQGALERCRVSGARGSEAWVLWLKGDMAAQSTRPEAAQPLYAEALAIAEQLELRPLIVRCHLGLGRVGGERSEEHLQHATELARDIDMALPLGEVRD